MRSSALGRRAGTHSTRTRAHTGAPPARTACHWLAPHLVLESLQQQALRVCLLRDGVELVACQHCRPRLPLQAHAAAVPAGAGRKASRVSCAAAGCMRALADSTGRLLQPCTDRHTCSSLVSEMCSTWSSAEQHRCMGQGCSGRRSAAKRTRRWQGCCLSAAAHGQPHLASKCTLTP